jgi:hypothetical protein
MHLRTFLPAIAVVLSAFAQSRINEPPRPPKPDVPFLLHATNLVETEAAEAKEEKKKNDTTYYVPGVKSSARTPLAEPIFIIRTEKIQPEKLELYRLEVKNNRREITFPERRSKNAPRPYPLSIRKLADGIWRVEASATLENGQYALTPSGSNIVFLFEVY